MCVKGQVKPMQCPYCGRDIPDDARWCPYCGGEQTPPEDDLQNEILPPEDQQDASAPPDDGNGEHFPSGWQDSAPADDWDDEAEPQDDPRADDPPVPGWEDDAPYEPAPEDRDAPRSKALLIAIFAALGVAPVSYTHLDVYKREVSHRARSTFGCAPSE